MVLDCMHFQCTILVRRHRTSTVSASSTAAESTSASSSCASTHAVLVEYGGQCSLCHRGRVQCMA